jgi:tetratricopeptide (TPR) repeat protein
MTIRRARAALNVPHVHLITRIFLIIWMFWTLCTPGSLTASPVQEEAVAFSAANELYRGLKYQEAARAYEKILAGGYESAALYYNLGNALFKAGNAPAAILNYERAKRLAPRDEDIGHNLALANLKIVDRIEPIPRLFFVEWWEALVGAASASAWGTAAIAALWVSVILLALFRVSRGRLLRRLTLIPGLLALLFVILAFTAGRIQDDRESSEVAAILFAATAPVKSAPDAGSTDLFVLHEGVRVDLLDAVGEWRKIRLADGKIGWLPVADLKVI